MSVTAEIQTRSRTNVLAVPIQSVTTRLPKKSEKPGADTGTNTVASTTADTTSTHATNAAGADTPKTNAASASTESTKRKPNDPPKPVEVVFVVENDRAKMVPVERGISDDSYTEIIQGVAEGQDVISGGYKAISRDLEDGKRIRRSKETGPDPDAPTHDHP
jgi:HlyD family secretion protein